MKNSAKYEKKIKKLFTREKKAPEPKSQDLIELMLFGILEEDTTSRKSATAMAALREEFVDFNELRAAPVKDVVECVSEGLPAGRQKAQSIVNALKAIFTQTNSLSLDYVAQKTKRELRALLRKQLGLSPYAESVLTLLGFAGHAIPVDGLLLEALKLDDLIHPESDIADLQGFLERIVLYKDAVSCHQALRSYAAEAAPCVAKELARREKLARAKAEAEERRKAEAVKKAEAKKAAAEKAKKAKKGPTEPRRKAAAKKATKAKKKTARKTLAKSKSTRKSK